jgi:hypothetical protein
LDRGSHFKNEMVRRVQKKGQASFHYGELPVVERHYRVSLHASYTCFRAVLSELKMYADEWAEVVNMVQIVLNNSLSTRLNKRTPMEVFTGHADINPLALMLKDNVPVNAPLKFVKAQKLMEIEKLSMAMTEIYEQVAEKATRDRKAAI